MTGLDLPVFSNHVLLGLASGLIELSIVALNSFGVIWPRLEGGTTDYLGVGGRIELFPDALPQGDVVVDALFGIGLSRAPDAFATALIDATEIIVRTLGAISSALRFSIGRTGWCSWTSPPPPAIRSRARPPAATTCWWAESARTPPTRAASPCGS